MKVFAPREVLPGERRVAITPDSTHRLKDAGLEVAVENGAGTASNYLDHAYEAAGAEIVTSPLAGYSSADAVVKVQPPGFDEVDQLRQGSILICFLQPAAQPELVQRLRQAGTTSFSLELIPRISRAQGMDALSSQASVAGYKAVLLAANRLGKYFPMLMSAAGTIAPARVLVLGAGVAGLQAIATARRLGAMVEAYDVRLAASEEVRSLGATFLEPGSESQAGEGEYAREQPEELLKRQQGLLAEHVAEADVVICTAAVPGRPAPVLITAEMVERMRRGSVIIDAASETGGNCELTQGGTVIETEKGVFIDGTTNLPSLVPVDASQLLARNIANLLTAVVRDGELALDLDDELISSACVTHRGELISKQAQQMMGIL
jgi:H+-translocating NAD(P) transhydrogenase subunit alpha